MTYTVAIIGGGITGLTTAYKLVSAKKQNNLPINIILLESSERLGGVIKSEIVDDFIVEHGPDAFLVDKPELKNLLSELNLDSQIIPINKHNRQAFIAQNNNLIPLPSGFYMIAPVKWWPFVSSPLFTLAGKLRIALEAFLPRKKTANDENVSDFLERRFGNELLKRVGQPLVGSIYMADINLLSAQSTLPQFVSLEQKHGSIIKGLINTGHQGTHNASGARYNLFASLKYGIQMLVDRLASQLPGVEICLNTKLLSVDYGQKSSWKLETNTRTIDADAIVFALPAKISASIIAKVDNHLSNALSTIKNSSSAIVNLLYKQSDISHPHKGFGFVVPTTENKKIIAAGFISQKFAQRASDGYEMIRVFIGGQLSPQMCKLSEKELLNIAQDGISEYLQIKNPPLRAWLIRWEEGLPFYQTGHKKTVEEIESFAQKFSGLFFAGSSYHGVGIPDCIGSGEKAAKSVCEFIRKRIIENSNEVSGDDKASRTKWGRAEQPKNNDVQYTSLEPRAII